MLEEQASIKSRVPSGISFLEVKTFFAFLRLSLPSALSLLFFTRWFGVNYDLFFLARGVSLSSYCLAAAKIILR